MTSQQVRLFTLRASELSEIAKNHILKKILCTDRSMKYSKTYLSSNIYFLLSRVLANLTLVPALVYLKDSTQVAEWYIYYSIFIVIQVFDSGLVSVGTRILSYNISAYPTHNLKKSGDFRDFLLLELTSIRAMLQKTYMSISLIGPPIVLSLYLALNFFGQGDPLVSNYEGKLTAFCLISGAFLYSNYFTVLLNAMGRYKFVQIYKGTTQWLSTALAVILLYFDNDIFFCALAYHMSHTTALLFLGFFTSTSKSHIKDIPAFDSVKVSHEIMSAMRKTFLGLILISGLQQLTGVYITEIYGAEMAAIYFISLQILRVGNTLGRSPLYSQLPNLYRKANKEAEATKKILRQGFFYGILTYIFVAFFAPFALSVLALAGAASQYNVTSLYWLIAAFLFAELLGALIAESLTLWKKIIWQDAAVATLMIFISTVYIFEKNFGAHGIIIALTIAYSLGFIPVALFSAVKTLRTERAFQR